MMATEVDLPADVRICCQAIEKASLFTKLIHEHFLNSPSLKDDASPVTCIISDEINDTLHIF